MKMAFSAEKLAVLLALGILVVSNAINASTDGAIENSVGGLFHAFYSFWNRAASEYVQLRK